MCKTIKQRVKFKAPPATIYDLLADSRKHSAVTGRKANINSKIGGTFSTGGDDVTGINVDLVPAQRIVQAVLGIARGLNLHTIAEGVETAEQLHSIASEGCTEMQGSLFSKPLPAAEIERQFLSGRAKRDIQGRIVAA